MLRISRSACNYVVWIACTSMTCVAAHKTAFLGLSGGSARTALGSDAQFDRASSLKAKARTDPRPVFNVTFTDIDVPGAVNVYAWDINNLGDLAGFIDEPNGNVATFYRIGGVIKLLRYTDDHPGSPYNISSVSSIDEHSTVLTGNWGTMTSQKAGYYVIASKQWVEFPDIPGYRMNFGVRRLDSGVAAGFACRSGDYSLAWDCVTWLWDGARYKLISFNDEATTLLNSMNENGYLTGTHFNQNPGDPNFKLQGYKGTALPRLQLQNYNPSVYGVPSTQSVAYDTNEVGVSVGRLEIDGTWHAYRDDRGFATLLPEHPSPPSGPPVELTGYFAINMYGEMFGFWVDPVTGQWRAFTAKPAPAPGR